MSSVVVIEACCEPLIVWIVGLDGAKGSELGWLRWWREFGVLGADEPSWTCPERSPTTSSIEPDVLKGS